MDVLSLFPEKLQNSEKYPYFTATAEVLQVVVSMYHGEIVESIKQLYNVDGDYYIDNLLKDSKRAKLAKENIDLLSDAFLPFLGDFIYTKSYDEKRGLLSFSDALYSMRGSSDNLISILKLLNFPMSIYTKDGHTGDVTIFSDGREEISRVKPETETLKCGAVEPSVGKYREGHWQITCNGRPVSISGSNLFWRGKSSYALENFNADIKGFIYVEKGKEYAWIMGTDDGGLFEIEGYGRCHVPYNNPNDAGGNNSWEDLDSWKFPGSATGSINQGHPFKWGSNWINFIAEETGYVPIRVRKDGEAGSVYCAQIVGGEKDKVITAIREVAKNASSSIFYENTRPNFPPRDANMVPKQSTNGITSFQDVTYETLPRWYIDYHFYIKLGANSYEQITGNLGIIMAAPYQEMVYEEYVPPEDPANLLEKYDLVISMNLNDPDVRRLLKEANITSKERYGLSLTGAITAILKNFLWVCADSLAYFYYACSDIVSTESAVATLSDFSFREMSTTSNIFQAVNGVSRNQKGEKSTITIKPEVPEFPYIDRTVANGKITNNVNIDAFYDWDSVSTVNGTTGTGNPRATIVPGIGSIATTPLLFQRGGVYVNSKDYEGYSANWFSTHAPSTWATYNTVKENRNKFGGNKLDSSPICVFNNINDYSCPSGMYSSERVSTGEHTNGGNNGDGANTIIITDKITVTIA